MITFWTVLTLMYGIQDNIYTQHMIVESLEDCREIIDAGLHATMQEKYGIVLASCKETSDYSYFPKPKPRPTVGE
tara:strand:- start:6707 stop:6931 length:225 start_codon:yes stop_codon:yes gene_type:complete